MVGADETTELSVSYYTTWLLIGAGLYGSISVYL